METIGPGLAIGLSEANANLLWRDGAGPQSAEFEPWRRRVAELRPHVFRLVVDWAGLQPDPSRPAALDLPADGCARGAPPCGRFAGIRDQLRAIRSQHDGNGGFQVMVVFYGVPAWAAAPTRGCERPGIQPRSRPITAGGLEAYRALVRQVFDLSRREGVDIRWWSPWNEPNGAFFISPQRATCSKTGTPVSPVVYTRLARALRSELGTLPGDQRLVVGDLAGVAVAGAHGTGSGEFLRELPDDVVCGAEVVAQHAYANLPGDKRTPGDPVAETEKALNARACAKDIPLWITETGVGAPHAGDDRPTGPEALRRQCVAFYDQLVRWHDDPRIQAAFQYTFREDTAFPVGLADAGLTRTYPTYDMLRAWAGTRRPDSPAPPLPDSCRG